MCPKDSWIIIKKALPQHTDHAGVVWHGSYLNWLEEARIDALSKVGLDYQVITNKGFELPVINVSIKYLAPILIGQEVIIKSQFQINDIGPKVNIKSELISYDEKIFTKADLNLVLINKESFKIIKKRPDFLKYPFKKLNKGP